MKKIILLLVLLISFLSGYSQPTGVRGQWQFSGIISSYAPHGYMYFDANVTALACAQNVPSTITNGGTNLFTVVEQDSMIIAGDTIRTITRGSYLIFYSFTLTAANNDDFRFSCWANSLENPVRLVITTKGAASYSDIAGFIYLDNLAPLSNIKFSTIIKYKI
jgi:hypothetical protein